MIVFRLVRKKYGFTLSGEGSKIAGGRWNSKDFPLIYTSDSRSLCTAEVAVSLPIGIFPGDFEMLLIEIPDEIVIQDINLHELPSGWRRFPYLLQTQRRGDQFIIENQFLVLKVPSAVVPGDFNFLINPRHPDFRKIQDVKSEPFEFDERFFNR
jgi:RES domain-containing protein